MSTTLDGLKAELPRYRLRSAAFVNSVLWREGQIITHCGWPTSECEPINEAAHKVVRYWNQHHASGGLPHRPYDMDSRCILPDEEKRPPRWVAETDMFVGGLRMRGSVFDYNGWPRYGMRPLNDAARQVQEYHDTHAGDALPHPAWDLQNERLNVSRRVSASTGG